MNISLNLATPDRRRPRPADESSLGFGSIFSDHMVRIEYDKGQGWHDARVEPYGPIVLDPAAMVFHYGQEIFEGLKAYRWADGGYAGKLIAWVCSFCQWVLEIVKRSDDVKGFKLLPKRWVVERTFSWLSNYRRLSKHYEYWNETGEAMIHLAMIHVMLRRLARKVPQHVVT